MTRFHRLPEPTRRSTVSVVVPCYNYGHYVGQAVDSVLSQDGVDTEVIVVDDASPDGSGSAVRALAERLPGVHALIHEQNKGHIATYNDGLARARGDYVLLLSADDVLTPGSLARAVGTLQKYPDVGLVYGFAPSFQDELAPLRRQLPHCTVWPGSQWLTRVCERGQNPVSTPTAVMRRDLLDAVGLYHPDLPHAADLLMWLRCAGRSDVAYVNGTDQAQYRVHGSNMHITTFAQLTADLEQRRQAFAVFADELADAAVGRHYLELATAAIVAEAARARTRLDPAADDSAAAAAALEEFVARSRPAAGTARPTVLRGLPAGLIGRSPAVGSKVDWRYWRRFGLRL